MRSVLAYPGRSRNTIALLALLGAVGCSKRGDVERPSRLKEPAAAGSTAASSGAAAPHPDPAASAAANRGKSAEGSRQSEAVPPSAPTAEKRRTYRVLALGDSITDQRVGGGGYLRELGRACPRSQFDHFGRGGDMTNQMRRRFEQELSRIAASYDTLIVYGGVNDLYSDLTAGRTNELIEGDLSAIYQAAQERGLYVVAITVSPWGGFTRYFNEQRSRSTLLLNSWILGTPKSGETDVVVDSYGLLSCGEPERLCADYEGTSHDGLHPGPKGHALLGQALLERAFSDCE